MAFGGREIRLLLSVQSYGTTNIARLRRDITSLGAATKAANANQLAVQKQMVAQSEKIAASQTKLRSLEKQRLVSTGLPTLKQELRLRKMLNQEGIKGAVLNDAIAGQVIPRNLSNQGRAALNSLRAIESTRANIARQIEQEKIGLSEAAAQQARLSKETMAQAAALDKINMHQQKLLGAETRGRVIAHAGRTAQFGGLIGTAISVGAASSFANFNKEVTLAASQTRQLSEPFSVITKRADELTNGIDVAGKHIDGIIGLMNKFPASGDEMAAAAYDIFSSVTKTFTGPGGFREGLTLLAEFNKLAVATGTDLKTATSAGITVLNNFGKEAKDVDAQLNLMVATVRFGRMTLDDFNTMLSKVAPAAAASGQSLKDVAGAMALITTRQPSQRMSATGIARLLQTFRDPDFQKGVFNISKGLVDITKGRGAVGVLKPLPIIINDLAKSFGGFQKFGGPNQLFKELTAVGRGRGIGRQSRIEAANAYIFLTKNLKDYQLLQRLVIGDTKEFAAAFQELSKSPGVQWAVFTNQIRALVLVLGEAMIPTLLKVAALVENASNWFKNLSDRTRGLIGSFIVWGSVSALVLGTLVNIGGSLMALRANMALVRLETLAQADAAGTAAVKSTLLLNSMKALSALTLIAIPIAIQLIRGGDPSAWGVAMLALQGAAAGGLIGSMIPGVGTAIGAGIGALTLPIVVKTIARFQGTKDPLKKAYGKYVKNMMDETKISVPNFIPGLQSFEEWKKAHPKLVAKLTKETAKGANDQSAIIKKYNDMLRRENKASIDEMINQSQKLNDAFNAQDAADKKRGSALVSANKEAMRKLNDNVKTAAQNLMNTYQQLHDQNEQALGGLFQGPTMQGIFGNIFGQINDQLRQFGIQIPIPFNILKQDVTQSITYFKEWRKDLSSIFERALPVLGRKGATQFVQQIQAMGPQAGIPIAEGLLSGGKEGFKSLLKQWSAGQKLLDQATKEDMARKLKYWNAYGKDAAWQTIMGMIDDPKNAKIRDMYTDYVKKTYGGVLQSQFKKDVAEALAIAQAGLSSVGKATGAGMGGSAKGGVGSKESTTRLAHVVQQMNQWKRILKSDQARLAKLAKGGFTKAERPEAIALTMNAALQRSRIRQAQKAELASIRKQMHAQSVAAGPHRMPFYTITYMGDTVTIKADGATPESVMRAFNKHHFKKTHRRKPPRGA